MNFILTYRKFFCSPAHLLFPYTIFVQFRTFLELDSTPRIRTTKLLLESLSVARCQSVVIYMPHPVSPFLCLSHTNISWLWSRIPFIFSAPFLMKFYNGSEGYLKWPKNNEGVNLVTRKRHEEETFAFAYWSSVSHHELIQLIYFLVIDELM